MAWDLSRIDGRRKRSSRTWHGAAFVVEALVLLAFLMASLAVLVQLMGAAHDRGEEADRLTSAIVLASNDAEAFAADPASGSRTERFQDVDGALAPAEANSGENAGEGAGAFEVQRTVTQQDEGAGTLFSARIAVSAHGEIVYELDTSRYVSDEGAAR